MTIVRTADGFSSADVQGMSLDPQAQDPNDGYQTSRDLASQPDTDGQDPATPGGAAPYNGAEPTGAPVTSNPEWTAPDEPKKPPYTDMPYAGPGPSVDTTTLHNARRQPMEEKMTVDLWMTASQDAEAEQQHERMVRAKVAVAGYWPFLSAALSEREFGHRLALVEDRVEELFPEPGFRDQVVASLREDYRSARTAAAQPAPGNPDYFADGPEAGPNTGSDGQFAQFPAGPDPYNPMNAQFPMEPGQWTVPPDKGWVDRPMNFGHTGAVYTALEYSGEGVQTGPPGSGNPDFFSEGSEGVQSDGFAPDVSLPEPDERVDMAGSVPPASSRPAPANQVTGKYVLAEKDNHGACAGCNQPVYREGDTWKHLGGNPGHAVRLHDGHPWIANAQASRVMAAKTAEYQYVKPNPDGDGYVVTQKGTGKVLSHHDTEEKAIESFKAMMTHKHEGSLDLNTWYRMDSDGNGNTTVTRLGKMARWVLAEASSSDTGTGQDSSGSPPAQVDTGAAPAAPASMEGGPGATAGTPLTIPNSGVSANPMATGQPPPQAQPAMPTVASWRLADVRERPTAENPSGVSDEYAERTWNAAAEQRPMQASDSRNVNTPQRPGRPIPTVETRQQDGPTADEDEEDED